MPYCPKCRAKYKKGFTECIDCNVELVDKLPPKKNDKSKPAEIAAFENEVVLETFEDDVEFMYVTSMLDEMGIPYRVRTKEKRSVKRLYIYNVKIEKTVYVDDKDYETAEEVLESLDAYLLEDYDDDSQDSEDEYEE